MLLNGNWTYPKVHIKLMIPARVARLVEHRPVHLNVVGSILSGGMYGKQPIDVSLSKVSLSLSLPLSLPVSKHVFRGRF